MPENTIQTIQNGRAKFAYDKVKEAQEIIKSKEIVSIYNKKFKISGNYTSYVKKIPMYVKVNGLGNAIAFVKSKTSCNEKTGFYNEYQLIYDQLNEWMNLTISEENFDLLEKILDLDTRNYRFYTNEIMSLLNWIKRFAEAMVEENDE